MQAAYQHLALSEVKPGMVLSDELLDQQGQILLPKGAVLNERTIALLPRHGIEMLAVLCDDPPSAPPQQQDPAIVEARMAHLFRKHLLGDERDWATGLLRQYMTDFRLDQGQQ
jgi:hypothetical protein